MEAWKLLEQRGVGAQTKIVFQSVHKTGVVLAHIQIGFEERVLKLFRLSVALFGFWTPGYDITADFIFPGKTRVRFQKGSKFGVALEPGWGLKWEGVELLGVAALKVVGACNPTSIEEEAKAVALKTRLPRTRL